MVAGRLHRFASDEQRLGDERTDDAVLTRARNRHPLQRRMIPNVVRRVAVRDLPEDLALVEADRTDAAVRRLDDWQPLDGDGRTTFSAATACGRRRSRSTFGAVGSRVARATRDEHALPG